MKQLICVFGLLIPVMTVAGESAGTKKYENTNTGLSNPIISDPLPIQMESKYVTDRSLWGRLIFDRNKVSGNHQKLGDKEQIMDLIR